MNSTSKAALISLEPATERKSNKFTHLFYFKLISILVLFGLLETLRAAQLQGFTRAECCFVEGAREMLLHKQYIAPLFHDAPYFDKPPLHYWLIIWFYKAFGVSLLNARMVSVAATLFTVAITAVFVRTILGETIAILTSLILSTTIGFYELGSTAMPDMLLCLFENLTVLSAYKVFFEESKANNRSAWLSVMAMSFALGWMTKGPIAVLIPGISIVLCLTIFKQFPNLSSKKWLLFFTVFFVLFIPWHIVLYKNYGLPAFEWEYLRGNVKRYIGLDPGYNFGHPITYITTTLLSGFLPWTFVLIPALCIILISILKQKKFLVNHKFLVLLVLWAFTNTLFFSFSSSNWGYYSLPIYPTLAVLTAYFLIDLAHKLSPKKIQFIYTSVTAIFFLGALVYSLLVLPIKASRDGYLNFANQIKQIPIRIPFYFFENLNGQYLLVDHIGFQTGRIPICFNRDKLIKMAFSFQPFAVILPKHDFEELPSTCKAKLKVIEVETFKWINFPGCTLSKEVSVGTPVTLILATHRCQLNLVASEALLAYVRAQNILLREYLFNNKYPTIGQSFDLSHWDKERKKTDGLASWWLAKAYFADPNPPDMVILGDSELGALQGADAYVNQRLVDLTGDHRSYTLEHDLEPLLHKHWHVLVAGLPEAMMSDLLLVSRALFLGEYKPKLVAIICSPREFIDATCTSIMATEPFAFFSKYANLGFDPHLSAEKNHSQFSQGRTKLASLRSALEESRSENYHLQLSNNYCYESSSPLTFGEPFERICPKEIVINSRDGNLFSENTIEYKNRYQHSNVPQLTMQWRCLSTLLMYLKQQGIKSVVFNVPLTSTHRNLLPNNFWLFYNQQISKMCQQTGADYIDLDSDWKAFTDKEFMDSIHLNLAGGLKLTRPIALFTANKFHWVDFTELRRREHKMF